MKKTFILFVMSLVMIVSMALVVSADTTISPTSELSGSVTTAATEETASDTTAAADATTAASDTEENGGGFNPLDIMKYLLAFLNSVFGSYALAIIIFTVFVNSCMIPFNIKEQKSTTKQTRLKPKLDELKEKYSGDKMKYNSAMTELYQKEGVSPAGGCLPMLLRMVLLIWIYQSIRSIINSGTDINFDLFGIDLSQRPVFSTNILKAIDYNWLIPLLSFVTSMLSSVITMKQNKINNPQAATGGMGMMMLIMPLFSIYIAFQVEGAVGFYWMVSNVVMTAITLIINHIYSPNKILARQWAQTGLERRKLEFRKKNKID